MSRIIVDGQATGDAIQDAAGVSVSKDGAGATLKRGTLNFQDTGPVTVTATDDGPGGKVDIHVDASAALAIADHATLDHTGIPGVGVTDWYQVLDATATWTDIQNALNDSNTRIVYLKPGNYAFGSGGLSIPSGKQLIGLSEYPTRDRILSNGNSSLEVVFTLVGAPLSGSNPLINMQSGSVVKNIFVEGSGLAGSGSGPAFNVQQGSKLENCIINNWWNSVLSTGTGPAVISYPGSFVRNVLCYSSRGPSFSTVAASFYAPCVIEHCTAYNGGSNSIGFYLSGGALVTGCYSFGNQYGFRRQSGLDSLKIVHSEAYNNDSDGFLIDGGSDGTLIMGCYSYNNGGWGFNVSGGIGGRAAVVGCGASGNVSGGFNFPGGWQNFANWNV